jgi:hypothetical protein
VIIRPSTVEPKHDRAGQPDTRVAVGVVGVEGRVPDEDEAVVREGVWRVCHGGSSPA